MTTGDLPKYVAIYLHTIFNGGIERVIFALSTEMIRRQIKVDIVVNFPGFSPLLAEIPVGANFVNLGCHRFTSRLPSLVRYMREQQPECMLSAGHLSNEIAVLAKLISKTKIKVVVSEHTNLRTELKSFSPFNIRRVTIPLVCRVLYRLADGIIAVSDGVRRDSQLLFRLKARVCRTIYNPVDVDRIRELSGGPVDHPWFARKAFPIVLGIGRLERQKNFVNLLEAFSRVRRCFDARLVILGEGSERDALTSKIVELGLEKDVWLGGFVENPYPYLKRASVFALSSEWEGLPISLIEALALDVPVVSTDCPSGPSEILASGEYGTIVPIRDSDALARGILRVLSGYRPSVPKQALARYAVESVVDQYLDVMSASR